MKNNGGPASFMGEPNKGETERIKEIVCLKKIRNIECFFIF